MFEKRNEILRFLAVADAGGICVAADRLSMTQPALTRVIARLEERVGARLFERTPTGVRLTPLGDMLVPPARRVLHDLEITDATVDAARSGRTGRFRVTADPVWAQAVLTQALARFHNGYPEIEVEIEVATRAEGLRRLASGESDMHCGGPDSSRRLPPNLRREPFLDVTVGIVARHDHPLLARDITGDDLVRWPWIDFDGPDTPVGDGDMSLAALFDHLYETTRSRVRTVVRTGTAGLFLMAGGPYLARLSLTFLERLPGAFLRPLPVTLGRMTYRSGFVARRSTEDIPPFRRFEAIVRDTALGRQSET